MSDFLVAAADRLIGIYRTPALVLIWLQGKRPFTLPIANPPFQQKVKQ